MMLSTLLQSAAVTPDQAHLISDAMALGVIVGVDKVWNHWKGKKRDRSMGKEFRDLKQSMTEVKADVKDLKAYVVGPDGSNGIRADVRELKSDMDELKRKGLFNTPPEFPVQKPARYEP